MGALFPLVLALCYAGWCLLCLGMEKHHREFFAAPLASVRRQALRGGGGLVLVAAFALCVFAGGWEFGPVAWACALMLSALLWVLLLPYARRWALRLAWVLPAAALLAPFAA